MRTPLVAGNWKMNGSASMTDSLCSGVVSGARQLEAGKVEILVCPPYPYLALAGSLVADSNVSLGAQDMDINDDGAYTGQVSAAMLQDCGCEFVILGHSERRTLYGETDAEVAAKVAKALLAGLKPILCVGETQQEREAGTTETVVTRQINAVLEKVGVSGFENTVIAYEPVWAIGTGLTATPEQAQEVHAHIRGQLATLDQETADDCRILYGGSMKPGNAAELLAKPDIDGGLIGGAALAADDFLGICSAA